MLPRKEPVGHDSDIGDACQNGAIWIIQPDIGDSCDKGWSYSTLIFVMLGRRNLRTKTAMCIAFNALVSRAVNSGPKTYEMVE